MPQIRNSSSDWFHYWTGHVFAYNYNWIRADNLKNYLRDKLIDGENIAVKIGSWSKMGTGAPHVTYAYVNNSANLTGDGKEVVFYDWNGGGIMDHAALCVANNTTSTYYLQYETGGYVYNSSGSRINEGTGDLIDQHTRDREKVLWHGDYLNNAAYSDYARIALSEVDLEAYRVYAFKLLY